MTEQKQVEKEENEEEIKPTKENVSDEYLKGYRVGYNRAVKRFKRNKLEIQVKKDQPITKEKEVKNEEVKQKDENPKSDNNRWLWLVIAVALGLVVFLYVVRTRNREPTQ